MPALILVVRYPGLPSSEFLEHHLSLATLPVRVQRRIGDVLFFPLGALLVVFVRLTLGLRVLGPFRPVLIAIAFRIAGIAFGVAFLCLTIGILVGIRPQVKSLAMPYFARVSVMLSAVSAIIVARAACQRLDAIGVAPGRRLLSHRRTLSDRRGVRSYGLEGGLPLGPRAGGCHRDGRGCPGSLDEATVAQARNAPMSRATLGPDRGHHCGRQVLRVAVVPGPRKVHPGRWAERARTSARASRGESMAKSRWASVHGKIVCQRGFNPNRGVSHEGRGRRQQQSLGCHQSLRQSLPGEICPPPHPTCCRCIGRLRTRGHGGRR